MRLVIVGATGNAGTSLLRAVRDDPEISTVVGIARRRPDITIPKVTWVEADVTSDDLVPLFEGADAVVHLAWLIQPSHDLELMRRVNVDGSIRVFEAVAEAKVPALVYASSIGAYSPGPKKGFVDESWPTNGIPTSFYSRHKAETEWVLHDFESRHRNIRVVRLRPGLKFKRGAASGVRRLFAGPFFPSFLARPGRVPIVPNIQRLRFQVVHSLDIGDAYRLAAVRDVHGAFNVAADPVLDPPTLARLLDARLVPLPPRLVRAVANATWHLRLQPTPPGWVDLALESPLMDTTRARTELGWTPRYGADEAFLDLLEGLSESAGLDTPPLSPETSGPGRVREMATGVGRRPGV